jgi:hypothetical protein
MGSTMLDVQTLIDAACARAGSDDFGPDTWREGLEVLVRALNEEGDLNELGVAVFGDQIVGNLVNLLEIEQWYARHPEIADQDVVAPLFGLGLPRTGSTATSFLIACDRSRRVLRTWEAGAPCPPPEQATEDTDPRIAASQAGIDMTNEMFPDFVGMLPTSATGPQECLLIMAFDFRSQVYEGMALLPSYTEWLLSCDMEPAYRYHRRVLQLLQWRCPPTRWWLKTPSHMASIDALDAVYPDARFVMTHRDIGAVLPSVCAVKEALSSPVTEHVDPHALGRHEVDLWRESLRRLIEFRDAGREDRFFDVMFADVQRAPIDAMAQLFREMGDDLTDDTRVRMAEWWEQSRAQRRQGAPADPAHFGLDPDALRRDFAFYHDRFGVPTGS